MVEPSLAMVMKISPGWPSSNRPDGEVSFVTGDIELVRNRACVFQASGGASGWPATERHFATSPSSSAMCLCSVSADSFSFRIRAAFVGLLGVERL